MANVNFNSMSKNQLANILSSNLGSIKNTSKNGKLKDRVSYAGVHDSTKSDLLALVKEVATALGSSLVIPALAEEKTATDKKSKLKKSGSSKSENLTKAPAKPSAKKTEPKEEPKKTETKKEKPVSKTKKTPTLEEVLTMKHGVVLLGEFPETVEFDDTEYEIAKDITSMKKLHKAIEEQRDILIAFYFPKRNLKQFGYFNDILGKVSSFENDLDLAQPLYISEEDKVAYVVSVYTEAFFFILPPDFTPVDGVKIAGDIEFEIYEAK